MAPSPPHRPAFKLPILSYHNVGLAQPGVHPLLTVSPDCSAQQIAWLAHRGYSPIHTSDWHAWLKEKRPLPKRPVLITFDDGYAEMARYALPILRRYGFKAVVYIVTGLIGKTNEWDTRMGFGELRLMTERQIGEWGGQGIEFGAHTRDHADLRKLCRQANLKSRSQAVPRTLSGSSAFVLSPFVILMGISTKKSVLV